MGLYISQDILKTLYVSSVTEKYILKKLLFLSNHCGESWKEVGFCVLYMVESNFQDSGSEEKMCLISKKHLYVLAH